MQISSRQGLVRRAVFFAIYRLFGVGTVLAVIRYILLSWSWLMSYNLITIIECNGWRVLKIYK
jgi:hypothetical protein